MLLGLPSSHLDKQENKKGWVNVFGAGSLVCGWNLTHAARFFFWEGEEMVEFTTNGYFSCVDHLYPLPHPHLFFLFVFFFFFKCNLESFSQREVLKVLCGFFGDGIGKKKKISQRDFFLLFRTVSLAVWRSLAFHGLFNILLSKCCRDWK